MKKSICMFLVFVMLMSLNLLVACTNAEEDVYHSVISDYIEAYEFVKSSEKTSEISVELNGKKLEFDQPPVMVNDRVLVPMRAIFEALNADIYYDTYCDIMDVYITAIKGETEFNLCMSSNGGFDTWYYSIWNENLTVKGRNERSTNQTIIEDGSPMIVNGRTLVPVRLISESLNATVNWDSENRTVIIMADNDGKRRNDCGTADNYKREQAEIILKNSGYGEFYIEDYPGFDTFGKYWLACINLDMHTSYADVYKVYVDGKIEVVGNRYVAWQH